MTPAQQEALDAACALRNREGYYVSDYETTTNKIGLVGQIVGARIRNLLVMIAPFAEMVRDDYTCGDHTSSAMDAIDAAEQLLALADALAGVGQPPVVTRDAESPPITERSPT